MPPKKKERKKETRKRETSGTHSAAMHWGVSCLLLAKSTWRDFFHLHVERMWGKMKHVPAEGCPENMEILDRGRA
jgi:hypothetical protein